MSAFWRGKGRWICIGIAGLLLAAFCVLYLIVWIKSGEEDNAKASDCIIVLGAKTRDMTPSRALRARLEQAKTLYDQGMAPKILVCGGKGDDETVAEAVAMKGYLMNAGVPEADILTEPDSKNTRENLRFAKRILQENGMQTAILVTADYHMARARMLAEQEGLCITTSRAKSDWPGTWFSRVRECLSWIKYGLGLSNG